MRRRTPRKERQQAKALDRQTALAEELQAWRETRIRAAAKAAEKVRKQRAKDIEKGRVPSRGVDRVPSHLRGEAPMLEQLDYRRGDTYVRPDRDTKSTKSGRLRRDEPTPAKHARPQLRRVRQPAKPGRQVLFGYHPWAAQLLRARAQTPSQWLKAQRMLLKGYGVAFTTKRGDLAYDCGECGFHIRNGYDPDESGFWIDVMDHEQEHCDSESVAL